MYTLESEWLAERSRYIPDDQMFGNIDMQHMYMYAHTVCSTFPLRGIA